VIEFVNQQDKHHFITRRKHVEKKARAQQRGIRQGNFQERKHLRRETSPTLVAALSISLQLTWSNVLASRMIAHASAQVRTRT